MLLLLTGLGRIALLLLLYLFIAEWMKVMRAHPLFIEEGVRNAVIKMVWTQGPMAQAAVRLDNRQQTWEKDGLLELALPVEIGRDTSNTIQIADPYVSAFHARISQEGSGFVVSDLASRNGTWCNDVPVTHPVLIKPGDQIRCGETTLVFKG